MGEATHDDEEREVGIDVADEAELYPEDGRGDLAGLEDELEGSVLILVTIPFPLSELCVIPLLTMSLRVDSKVLTRSLKVLLSLCDSSSACSRAATLS